MLDQKLPDITYEIDLSNKITWVSDGWSAFAVENSGEHLVPPTILGRSLWDMISDQTTREIYRRIIERVRGGGGPASFRFRCDSPSQAREIEMRITVRTEDILSFTTRILRERQRPEVPLLDPQTSRDGAIVVLCGWCARAKLAEDRWVEVEVAVHELGMFEHKAMPMLSHGMCPSCYETMSRALGDEESKSPEDVVVASLPPE